MNTATLDLHSATITVQRVFDPKPGRKSGTVKDFDGRMFDVWPDQLRQFHEGETYDIEYTEKRGEKLTFRDIKTARPAAPSRAMQTPPERHGAIPPRRDLHDAAPTQSRPAPPAPAPRDNGNGNQWYRPTHPRDAERMFVCSTLNAFISTGRINDEVNALIRAVRDLRQVWGETFGADDEATG